MRFMFPAIPARGGRRRQGRRGAQQELAQARMPIEIVRNGSRGLYWLEPMVEVETARAASPTAR